MTLRPLDTTRIARHMQCGEGFEFRGHLSPYETRSSFFFSCSIQSSDSGNAAAPV